MCQFKAWEFKTKACIKCTNPHVKMYKLNCIKVQNASICFPYLLIPVWGCRDARAYPTAAGGRQGASCTVCPSIEG